MHTRDARNSEEAWLLDHIDEFGLDDSSFRSRDYILAIDDDSNARAAFGRIRIHDANGETYCEITSHAVLKEYEQSKAGERVVRALIERAADNGFDTVYGFFPERHDSLDSLGFEEVDQSEVPDMMVTRQRRKAADVDANLSIYRLVFDPEEVTADDEVEDEETVTEEEIDQIADELGIDRENSTHKYDTGL